MKMWRVLLTIVALMDLALIVVLLEARGTRLRYALARGQEAVRVRREENRKVLLEVARARRPDEVMRRAAKFGLDVGREEGEGGAVGMDRRRP